MSNVKQNINNRFFGAPNYPIHNLIFRQKKPPLNIGLEEENCYEKEFRSYDLNEIQM